MAKKKMGAAIMAGALLLTACADRNAANEANFKVAIAEAVKHNTPCLQIDGGFSMAEGIPVLIVTPANPSDEVVLAQKPLVKALANLGLVTLHVVHKPQPGMFGRTYQAPFIKVDLTDKGKPYARNIEGMPSLCFGRYAVDSVDRFSQPASLLGQTVSEAQYSYHLEDLPDWAHDPQLLAQSAWLQQFVASPTHAGKATLVLTNKGWEDERVARL
ncbi:hypothetical protein [Paraburkholderia domus]|uniref:hypothetical protein n=1 Tax=Paraburkholderia domus TaxID=2793075 RepID=UPI0019124C7D|nr:hypothetical protein [Paraburkholderia domus]MBK5064786.1 hypothetical protein [Burkholderia sp. R-70199]CAE6956332.1 hypothetical protein R70199_06980 [Paraburkholderia domus]